MVRTEKPNLSPFKRFEELTKGLLAVPRKEMQKKLEHYKRREVRIGLAQKLKSRV